METPWTLLASGIVILSIKPLRVYASHYYTYVDTLRTVDARLRRLMGFLVGFWIVGTVE